MNENQTGLYLLEKENVKRALIKLGIPTMIGLMVSALYNMADTFFVGQLGTTPQAAVSVVFPLTMIGTAIGLLFGNGAASYISRLLGKRNFQEVEACSSTAIITGLITAALILGMILLYFNPLMIRLGATNSIIPYVREYGIIYIIGLFFNVFNMMLSSLVVAEGASSFSMAAMLTGGCLNLILDPLFIFTLNMGVRGAAVATLIARLLSVSMYIFYLVKRNTCLKISIHKFSFSGDIYKEVFKIGLPVCIYQLLTGTAITLTNVMAKPFGVAAIAAIGIVNRLMALTSGALFGFLKGYSPLVGYNYGAGNADRVKEATGAALRWSTITNITFGIVCIVFAKQIIYLFNHESAQVLEIGSMVLIVNAIAAMTLGIQIVIGNYFLAIGKGKQGGILSIARQGIFFIPLLLILTYTWGLKGLIFSQLTADICTTALTIIIWKNEKRNKE